MAFPDKSTENMEKETYCSQINHYTLGWQNVIKPAVQYGKQRLGAKKNHQICKTTIRAQELGYYMYQIEEVLPVYKLRIFRQTESS